MRWYDHITINLSWLGLGITSSSMTPLILPFLVEQFAPSGLKNTFYGQLRFYGLMVALFVQPLAGMLSDRSTLPWGRRRPFILTGAILSSLVVGIIGLTTGYWFLFVASLVQQAFSNMSHGAIQGLIPDLVPEQDRVRTSGIKAIFELLPVVLVSFTVAKMIDRNNLWGALLFIMVVIVGTMLITVLTVREKRWTGKPEKAIGPQAGRIALLTLAFMVVVQGSLKAMLWLGSRIQDSGGVTVPAMGLAGLVAIIGSIVAGVWVSVRLGLGAQAREHGRFTWWVINRLLFLAAVGSVQGFALYYLEDLLHIPNAAGVTARLMMVVGLLTLVSALAASRLAKLVGRLQLLAASGVLAALGMGTLMLATDLVLVYGGGALVGLATGLFMATNWAVGTDLVPAGEAGKFLGISNLAGAGAGAVGNGIGGPLADYLNALQPGLGYVAVFAIFGLCFLLSAVVLVRVKPRVALAQPQPA